MLFLNFFKNILISILKHHHQIMIAIEKMNKEIVDNIIAYLTEISTIDSIIFGLVILLILD